MAEFSPAVKLLPEELHKLAFKVISNTQRCYRGGLNPIWFEILGPGRECQCLRFNTDELSEVLHGIVSDPLLRVTFVLGPRHLDLFRYGLALVLLVRVETLQPDDRMPVLHQLSLEEPTAGSFSFQGSRIQMFCFVNV